MPEIGKILSEIRRDPRQFLKYLCHTNLLHGVSDSLYLHLVYYAETGKRLHLRNPVRYNEKLQWLKLHDRKQVYTQYVDKYEVRSHIRETIGEEYLIPQLCVCDSPEEIEWEKLPQAFVIKCTHGSGCNILCRDKSGFDVGRAEAQLRKWLRQSWYYYGREWPYKNVKPRILCEQYLGDSSRVPDDYKVMCFDGVPRYVQVHQDRFSGHLADYFTADWKHLGMINFHTPNCAVPPERPKEMDKILELSARLSQGIKNVRVDWYVVDSRIYFGELTLTDASGFNLFEPDEYDYIFGKEIDLSRFAGRRRNRAEF